MDLLEAQNVTGKVSGKQSRETGAEDIYNTGFKVCLKGHKYLSLTTLKNNINVH